MLKFALIADDLSGACDTAVQFSNFGYRTLVLNDVASINTTVNSNFNAIAITTNSRDQSIQEAKQKIREICQSLKGLKNIKLYKKIDSTWRGNIGAELEVILEELQLTFAIICSAYPENKRLGLGGYLLVDGQLLHYTTMAKDPGSPIKEGYLPSLLSKQTKLPIEHISLNLIEKGVEAIVEFLLQKIQKGPCLFIADAVLQIHLDTLAAINSKKLPPFIFVGSAGLSAALLRQEKQKAKTQSPPVLTVIGSVHPNSNLQIDELIKNFEVTEIYVPWQNLLHYTEGALKELTSEALNILADGNDLVIRTSRSATDVELAKVEGKRLGLNGAEMANAIASGLQKFMAGILAKVTIAGIMVTGGATALQLLEVMGAEGIEVQEEIEPGVPLGQIVGGSLAGMKIITKAGGFGSRKVFCQGTEVLKHYYQKSKGE